MKLNKKIALGAVVATAAVAANAQAAGPDFTTLTTAIDMSSVSTAVLAVAATMVAVYIAIKGAKIVLRMVRSA